MILKVLQPDTGKWFYYDKICLFKVKYRRIEQNEPTGGAANEICLLPDKRDPVKLAAVCDVNFENGRSLTITFEDEGYLLNDVGETIEKII